MKSAKCKVQNGPALALRPLEGRIECTNAFHLHWPIDLDKKQPPTVINDKPNRGSSIRCRGAAKPFCTLHFSLFILHCLANTTCALAS
jgi:hypothetical protein